MDAFLITLGVIVGFPLIAIIYTLTYVVIQDLLKEW